MKDAETGSADGSRPESDMIRASYLKAAGRWPLSISPEFLLGLQQALASGPDGGASTLYQVGRGWGHAWFSRLNAHAQSYFSASAHTLSLDEIQRAIEQDLSRNGWGRVVFDLESFASLGVMLVTLHGGPGTLLADPVCEVAALLQAGFFGGLLSSLSELPIQALSFRQPEGQTVVTHIVMVHESKIGTVRGVWEHGGSLGDVIRAMKSARDSSRS